MARNFSKKFMVKPGAKLSLADWDPAETADFDKKSAKKALKKNVSRLFDLQYLLYAQKKCSVLIILQAMDAAGKDGTIRGVMRGLNPQGCRVTPFKAPSTVEREHDFLWRVHREVPRLGDIGIFNRSHYEDVLVVRVRKLAPRNVWSKRFEQINDFERMLDQNQVKILKFFLHISKEEQTKRLRRRLDDPKRNWKLSPADVEERKYWDDYQAAYQEAISRCATAPAPWFVIPSNKKWFRDLAVSQIIVEKMESLRLSHPKPAFDVSKLVIE